MRHGMLLEAMNALNDREKHILVERRLVEEPKTLEELSQVYGVSRERVRQIEVRAFEKVQEAVQKFAAMRMSWPWALRPWRKLSSRAISSKERTS